MTGRQRNQLIAMLVLLPLSAYIGSIVLRLAMADVLSNTDTAAALRWWPAHHTARAQQARSALAADPNAVVAPLAKDVLRMAPMDGAAYALLAATHDRSGEIDVAAQLYAIASAHAPRDRHAHAWLADYYAKSGDHALMLNHVDELMRMMVRGQSQLFPAVAALIPEPQSRAILIRFLGDRAPPWREEFLRWLAAQPGAVDALAAVFAPLRNATQPLTAVERSAWIDGLIRAGDASQAYGLWAVDLSPERRGALGNVYDGGFELTPDNAGFGWQFNRVAGATIRQEATPGAINAQALLVEFHDQRVPFEHVRQTLVLPVSRYALSGRVRVDDLRNERGLQWVLRCPNGTELGATTRFNGNSAWRSFTLEFTIPATDCTLQTLMLRLDARIKPEQMIGGRIWFDGLRIQRLD